MQRSGYTPAASRKHLAAHRSLDTWSVLAGGLLFTGLLGALLLLGRTQSMEEMVTQRTTTLQACEAKFRAVAESAQDAIITSNHVGRIT